MKQQAIKIFEKRSYISNKTNSKKKNNYLKTRQITIHVQEFFFNPSIKLSTSSYSKMTFVVIIDAPNFYKVNNNIKYEVNLFK